jgi:hypothetical protein
MLSLPAGRVAVVHVAAPLLTVTDAHPTIELPLSVNATVPVGVIGDCGVIVAVNVTVWLTDEGETEDSTLVLLLALTTASLKEMELPRKFVSPE